MKRLLVYSTQLMETGGIESHLKEFCKNMASPRVEIDLVVLNVAAIQADTKFYQQYCKRIFFSNQTSGYKRLLWLIKIGLLTRMRKYDAVYTNGQGNSINLFTKLNGKNKLWLHHHHTSGDEADRETWGKGYKEALLSAHKIIACSGRNAREMSIALQREIGTIPCFSKKVVFQGGNNEPRQQIKFGYYGRLIPEKGIDILCRMSEEFDVNDIEFNIWGEGEAYSADHFKQYPKLKYHGKFAGADELANVINIIDGFLLLSTHPEGLPISLLEAMSAGLPWLATDRGGITDIAIDPLSTRVIPANSTYEQFKSAVVAFANDLRLNKVSRAAQEDLYNKKFSAKALVQRWNEALSLT